MGYENNNSQYDCWVHGGQGETAFCRRLPGYETDCLTDLLLEHLDVDPLHFTSNHASNYLPLKGGLPEDREKFLAKLDRAVQISRLARVIRVLFRGMGEGGRGDV